MSEARPEFAGLRQRWLDALPDAQAAPDSQSEYP